MSGTGEQEGRETGRARIARATTRAGVASPFKLSAADSRVQQEHFGVAPDQILHDFVISHVLAALEPLSDAFVFYGGTALSRTLLNGLRLSEDIDLLSIGPRAETARLIDSALVGLQRGLGNVSAETRIQDVPTDTASCTYRIGEVRVRIQLISAEHYPNWPTQRSAVAQRYSGLPDLELQTYTAGGFVAAKTVAWCDTTRNAPRDLYDLWALAERGLVTAGAANLYKKYGPTGGFPRQWTLPDRAPTPGQWHDALAHQCLLQIGPDEAFRTVVAAWDRAVTDAEGHDRQAQW